MVCWSPSSLLPLDDLELLCSTSPSLMEHATTWCGHLAELTLDSAEAVAARVELTIHIEMGSSGDERY